MSAPEQRVAGVAMPFENQLRLGRFNMPVALIFCRHVIKWQGDSHISVLVARGLSISKITRAEHGMFELVYSYRDAHEVELILEPHVGTPDHALFWRWENGGPARQFYWPIGGVKDRLAFLYASGHSVERAGQRKPYLARGNCMDVGHPLVVEFELEYVGVYVMRALTRFGVSDKDRRVIINRLLTELKKQERSAGF